MTIVVNDLVARFRSDTTDVQRGMQQARQEMAQTEQQARATAEQLDALSRKFAQSQGGPAAQWRQILETQRLSAAQVDEMLGRTAQSTQRVAAATQQIVQPTQAVARAASEVHQGFSMSESSIVRFGASLVGVGLGISLVAGAGRVLHDVITGIVDSQTQWERSLVQVRAIYGDMAPRIVALSQAQAALPGVTATQQDLLQANIQAGFLTRRYGVEQALTGRLTTQAALLGGMLVLSPEQQRGLQGAFLQYAEQGGEGLRDVLGLPGDATSIARQIGFRSGAALGGFTPQQLTEIRSQVAIQASAQANIQGSAQQAGLLDRQRDLQHALEQAQADLQQRLEGGPTQDDRLRALIQSEAPRNALEAEQQQQQLAELDQRQESYSDAVERARQAVEANSAAIADNQRQLEESTQFLRQRGIEPGTATARALDFFGSLEERYSIASYDVAGQAQQALAQRGRGALPTIGTPTAEIAFQATNQAFQDALQNMFARQAQATGLNPIRERLEEQANLIGPGFEQQRASARRALDEAQQAEPVQRRMADLRRESALVDLEVADRQAAIEQIAMRQRERTLQMLRETVDLRRLDVSQQMQGVRLGQDVIRAQQAALPAQNALADAQYQTTRAAVLAQARVARLMQGKDVTGMPSFNELIRMNIEGQFAAAEAGPAALEAGRGIQLAQRPATAAGLAQQLTASQVQLAEMAVDLQNLGDLPEQTALELELVSVNRDQLAIQRDLRDQIRELVRIMGGYTGGGMTPAAVDAQIAQAFVAAGGNTGIPASDQLAGARR